MKDELNKLINDFIENQSFDVEKFLKIGYDTYWLFKNKEKPRKIEPNELAILKNISVLNELMPYPDNCKNYEFDACVHFAKNLIDEISEDFPAYYRQNEMVVTRYYHCPAGCSDYAVDMTSFKSFYKDLIDFFFDEEEE